MSQSTAGVGQSTAVGLDVVLCTKKKALGTGEKDRCAGQHPQRRRRVRQGSFYGGWVGPRAMKGSKKISSLN